MPLVDSGDKVIEFPDSMSEDDIKSALDKVYKTEALQKGAEVTQEALGDVFNLVQRGAQATPSPEQLNLEKMSTAGLTGEAIKRFVAPAIRAPLEELGRVGGDLVTDFLTRTGIDPSAMPGRPIVKVPDLTAIPGTDIHPLDIISPDIRKGVSAGLKSVTEPFVTPEGVSTLPLLPLKPVQALYGASAAAAVPEELQRVAQAKNVQETAQAATEAGANIGMAGLIGRGLLRDRPRVSEAERPTVTETTPKAEVPETPSQTGLRPAIRLVGGDVIADDAGKTHPEIISEHSLEATDIDQRGFVDEKGNFLDREQAATKTQLPTGKEPERLHSTDLPEAKGISEEETKKIGEELDKEIKERTGVGLKDFLKLMSSVEGTSTPESALAKIEKPPTAQEAIESSLQKSEQPAKGTEAVLSEKVKTRLQKRVERSKQEGILGEEQPPATMTGAAHVSELAPSETAVGAEKYGVAERVREERAKAGQVEPVVPGQGINTPDSIGRGRALLQSDPGSAERLMTQFESDKKLSSDAMAVARAHGESLAAKARTIEERFGTDSPEYRAARDELSAWDKRSKAMQTEWHKAGMAQQGETDIDTGTYSGLERAFRERTGTDFTPGQGKTAKKVSKRVKDAADETQQATTALSVVLDHEFPKQKTPPPAEKAALDAASKTVRENAIRLANLESKQRVARTAAEKTTADEQVKAAKKALDAAQKVRNEAAARLAKIENENRVHPERRVWESIKRQMDEGETDLHKMRGKTAVELGMSDDKVTELMARTARVKRVADDLILKQQTLRRAHEAAKRWLLNIQSPLLEKVVLGGARIGPFTWPGVSGLFFKIRVGLHGTVAPGTHAPMLVFSPKDWADLIRNSAKMYKMVGLPTPGGQKAGRVFFEEQMASLVRDRKPDTEHGIPGNYWSVARRNGLINDPYQYEDFTSPDTARFFGDLTGMGNRGYSMLKLLRQDLFNRAWEQYPNFMRTDKMAKDLSDQLNHITGVTQKPPFRGSHYILFAPRLLLSRTAWLGADPVKALGSILNWKNASIEQKQFARREITGKLTVFATYMGMLAANQALLTLSGSRQKINGIPQSLGGAGINPNESDFLHFKAMGMDVSFGGPMINMARLPVRLVAIGMGPKGKLGKIIYPDDEVWTEAGRFLGGQMSPAAQIAFQTLITREDPTGKQLPHSVRPQPKRLLERGIKPYTWGEYVTQQLSPIPFQEMEKDIWGKNFGSDEQQIKAWTTLLFMLGTGGRMREDLPKKPTKTTLP